MTAPEEVGPAEAVVPDGVDPQDLAVYTLRLADDALVLGQRLGEWAARGPTIEEDVALLNIGLDLLGQARTLLTRVGEVDGTGRSEDDLAYHRDERDFLSCQLVEQPNGDFGQTMARQLLVSAWHVPFFAALSSSVDPVLAAVARKAVKESRYHLDHAATWVVRLGDGTPESHDRVQAGLEAVWAYAAELWEADDVVTRLVAAGVAPDPEPVHATWETTVDAVLADATLTRPVTSWSPSGGRRGLHTEHLGYLLAELQHVARSHPGASW
ncbi:1,2-phenylacetyl-CoA epoxidase subunit PaaC [Aquipuribacter nitratireducens]|uniref:1,2-phenylacetyl-CoA epoxidase subunit PaaC n=1 Tax=Aquipuribacter nitratireducens TaxID=650104 RepID=A0ABW0GRS2_9MICO